METVSSAVRYNDGKCSVAVSWKGQRPCLPNNRQVAEFHLRSTKRNVKKKGLVEKEHQKVIDTYEEKGYLCKVPESGYYPHPSLVLAALPDC